MEMVHRAGSGVLDLGIGTGLNLSCQEKDTKAGQFNPNYGDKTNLLAVDHLTLSSYTYLVV